MTTEQESQNPALREAERILNYITESYFDRPLPSSGREDAKKYICSKLFYAQTLKDPEFAGQEIETCGILLKEAKAGNWNPMVMEIRRIGVDFMNMNDQESARTARALFNLAFSITPDKTS